MSVDDPYPPDRRRREAHPLDEPMQPLPERRKGWREIVETLDKRGEQLESRFRRFYIQALFAFAVVGICCAVALGGFSFVLKERGKTSKAIQNQRAEFIGSECRTTNQRHDLAFQKVIAGIEPGADRVVTLSILDAVLPVRDCKTLVEEAVRGDS